MIGFTKIELLEILNNQDIPKEEQEEKRNAEMQKQSIKKGE